MFLYEAFRALTLPSLYSTKNTSVYICVYACACTARNKATLRHAVLECRRFRRVSAISHTSWKMSDPGGKHSAACDGASQEGRGAAAGGGGRGVGVGGRSPGIGPLRDDGEMTHPLDKCHPAKSAFRPSAPPTRRLS